MHVTKIEDLAEKLGTRNFSFKILKRHINEHDSVTYTITINGTKEFEAIINEPQNKRWVALDPKQGTWYHAKLQRYEDYDTWAFVPLGVMTKQPIDEEELPEFEEDEYNPFDIPEVQLDNTEEVWYNNIPESGYLCFDPDTHLAMLVFDHTSDKNEFIPLTKKEAKSLLVKKPKKKKEKKYNNYDI